MMHTNFDGAENFETLLAAQFNARPNVSTRLGEDHDDAGFRVVHSLVEDLSLDCSILDIDEMA